MSFLQLHDKLGLWGQKCYRCLQYTTVVVSVSVDELNKWCVSERKGDKFIHQGSTDAACITCIPLSCDRTSSERSGFTWNDSSKHETMFYVPHVPWFTWNTYDAQREKREWPRLNLDRPYHVLLIVCAMRCSLFSPSREYQSNKI